MRMFHPPEVELPPEVEPPLVVDVSSEPPLRLSSGGGLSLPLFFSSPARGPKAWGYIVVIDLKSSE